MPEATGPASLSLGAGTILYFNQSTQTPYTTDGQVFFVKLVAEGKYGDWSFYGEPRFRDTPLRSYWSGPAWVEQAFLAYDVDHSDSTPLKLKAGKIYSQLGLFWDNSFWGNVQNFDGLKLDADVGISAEGRIGRAKGSGLNYIAQFFPVDGSTNYSLPGRDTESLTGSRKRYITVGRLEPYLKLGENAVLKPAISAEYLRADIQDGSGPANDVVRASGNASLTVGPWGLWGEFTYQNGYTTHAFPYSPVAAVAATATTPAVAAVPGRGSKNNDYVLAGTEYAIGPVTARLNFSWVDYSDLNTTQWMVVPGIGWTINKYVTILAEYVEWHLTKPEPVGDTLLGRNVVLTLHGNFLGQVIGKN
jgi:hypothetical protein